MPAFLDNAFDEGVPIPLGATRQASQLREAGGGVPEVIRRVKPAVYRDLTADTDIENYMIAATSRQGKHGRQEADRRSIRYQRHGRRGASSSSGGEAYQNVVPAGTSCI